MKYSQAKTAFLAENLEPGEKYAGILLGKDGKPDQHIILLPGQATDVNWSKAGEWAKSINGSLPTRREQSLLFANLKEEFEERFYWSCEKHASDSESAWGQFFGYGGQRYGHMDYGCRARAVRRLEIQ